MINFKIYYNNLLDKFIELGYSEEIEWQRNLKPCDNDFNFMKETCWVILNSGMKEQIARKIWIKIIDAWNNGKETSEVFNHKGKVSALNYVRENYNKLFDDYIISDDKIKFLQTIPYIGKITCYHLAKNLGHDCIKPDRHLVRISNQFNMTPDELCEQISLETGEKKSVIDIVIWRSCNLKLI